MEIKVKIINSKWTTLWYDKYVGEEGIVNSEYCRILVDGEIFLKIHLTKSLKEKLFYDAKPFSDNDYGIYKSDTNFQQVERKEKLNKINSNN